MGAVRHITHMSYTLQAPRHMVAEDGRTFHLTKLCERVCPMPEVMPRILFYGIDVVLHLAPLASPLPRSIPRPPSNPLPSRLRSLPRFPPWFVGKMRIIARSLGTKETLGERSIQFMTAGSGVRHSEHNLSTSSPLRFIQIWIKPRTMGLKPNYGAPACPLSSASSGGRCQASS